MNIVYYGPGGELDRWQDFAAFVRDCQNGYVIPAVGDRIEIVASKCPSALTFCGCEGDCE